MKYPGFARLALLAIASVFVVTATRSEPEPLEPRSIQVRAPIKARIPYQKLGIPPSSWIVVKGRATVDSGGRILSHELEQPRVGGIDRNKGHLLVFNDPLQPEHIDRFERLAERALAKLSFQRGEPNRDIEISLGWKAKGRGMPTSPLTATGTLYHGEGAFVRVDGDRVAIYLWDGMVNDIRVESFSRLGSATVRGKLGLPSSAFVEEMEETCPVLDEQPRGVWHRRLDEPLKLIDKLRVPFPTDARRARATGNLIFWVRIAPDGSVDSVYPWETVPEWASLTETAIRHLCDARYNRPLLDGEPIYGIAWETVGFEIN